MRLGLMSSLCGTHEAEPAWLLKPPALRSSESEQTASPFRGGSPVALRFRGPPQAIPHLAQPGFPLLEGAGPGEVTALPHTPPWTLLQACSVP